MLLIIISFPFVAYCVTEDFCFIVRYGNRNCKLAIQLTTHGRDSKFWESTIGATSNVTFGEGTGDAKNVLNNFFSAHGRAGFSKNSMNAHNQYLHLILSMG